MHTLAAPIPVCTKACHAKGVVTQKHPPPPLFTKSWMTILTLRTSAPAHISPCVPFQWDIEEPSLKTLRPVAHHEVLILQKGPYNSCTALAPASHHCTWVSLINWAKCTRTYRHRHRHTHAHMQAQALKRSCTHVNRTDHTPTHTRTHTHTRS